MLSSIGGDGIGIGPIILESVAFARASVYARFRLAHGETSIDAVDAERDMHDDRQHVGFAEHELCRDEECIHSACFHRAPDHSCLALIGGAPAPELGSRPGRIAPAVRSALILLLVRCRFVPSWTFWFPEKSGYAGIKHVGFLGVSGERVEDEGAVIGLPRQEHLRDRESDRNGIEAAAKTIRISGPSVPSSPLKAAEAVLASSIVQNIPEDGPAGCMG
ncbi:hypothetical protein [Antarcticirhabdus aurantiaca]|uniref:hypothetical protein n=1 Tax=Antarcticirhabdus aurantiaca TaxID=2606717 RepID=UPI00131C123C|nr:hypothetical protein [Antarcticirhabdus aurantiaca]